MLEQLKDENGQLKKPVLISLIGAAGLVGYLILHGKGTSSSSGQSSPLTPDLTGLQTALQGLGGGGGGGGGTGGNPTDPPGGTVAGPGPIDWHWPFPTPWGGPTPGGPAQGGSGRHGGGSGSAPTTTNPLVALKATLDRHQLHLWNTGQTAALAKTLDAHQLHLLHLINTGQSLPSPTPYATMTEVPKGASPFTATGPSVVPFANGGVNPIVPLASALAGNVPVAMPGDNGSAGGGGQGLLSQMTSASRSPQVYGHITAAAFRDNILSGSHAGLTTETSAGVTPISGSGTPVNRVSATPVKTAPIKSGGVATPVTR